MQTMESVATELAKFLVALEHQKLINDDDSESDDSGSDDSNSECSQEHQECLSVGRSGATFDEICTFVSYERFMHRLNSTAVGKTHPEAAANMILKHV